MVSHVPLGPLGTYGKLKWEFIVKADNGNIYAIPSRATRVLKISPEDRSVTCIGPQFGTYPCKWGQGALADDGKIYCPPASHEQALCIDPETDTVSVFGTSYGLSKTLKWYCAVKAKDGKIYCPPLNFNRVLCINPKTMETEIWGPRLINHKYGWPSAALAENGRIYCCPCNPPQVLMIDPIAKDARPVGPDLGLGASKYFDCVKANDGALYCAPTLAARALRIKPPKNYNNDTISIEFFGKHLATRGKTWGSGALGHDGRIYCPPLMGSQILCIDPYKSTSEVMGPEIKGRKTESKWCGAVEANNGLMYCAPCDSSSVLGIDIDTLQYMAQKKSKGQSSNAKPLTMSRAERVRRAKAAKSFAAFRRSQVWMFIRKSTEGARMLLMKGIQRFLPWQQQLEQMQQQEQTVTVTKSEYEKEVLPFKAAKGKAAKGKDIDEQTEESVSTAGDEETNDTGSEVSDDESGSSDCGEIDAALDGELSSLGLQQRDPFNANAVHKLTSARLQVQDPEAKGKRASLDASSVATSTSRTSSSKKSSSLSSSSLTSSVDSSSSSSLTSSVASTPLGIHTPVDGSITPTQSDGALMRISNLMSKLSSKSSGSSSTSPLSSSTENSIASTPSKASSRKGGLALIPTVPEEDNCEEDAQVETQAVSAKGALHGKTICDDNAIALLRKKLGVLKSQRSSETEALDEAISAEKLTEKQIEDAMMICAPTVGSERRPCGVCGVGDTCAVQ